MSNDLIKEIAEAIRSEAMRQRQDEDDPISREELAAFHQAAEIVESFIQE